MPNQMTPNFMMMPPNMFNIQSPSTDPTNNTKKKTLKAENKNHTEAKFDPVTKNTTVTEKTISNDKKVQGSRFYEPRKTPITDMIASPLTLLNTIE